MKKKIIAAVLGVVVIAVGVYFLFFNKKSINGQVKSVKENLTSYHSEANMEMYYGEDVREFIVYVCYQKEGEVERFRVAMYDKAINQEQIILRNENGVYVLTPALNQVHQFKGSWPLNGPKPYLYQSLLNVFDNSYKMKKTGEGYLVTSKPSYKNSPKWVNQEIAFTKELKPLSVKITSDTDELQVRVTFTKFDVDVEYAPGHFNLDNNMQQSREQISSTTGQLEDLPLYPVNATYPANLVSQTVVSLEGNDYHILNYQGEKSFTIVQKMAVSYADMTIFQVPNGEIVDLIDGIGFFASSTLMFTYNGIEYKISSSDMVLSELVDVANGMDVVF